MRTSFKKRLSLVAGLTAAAFALVGCTAGGTPQETPKPSSSATDDGSAAPAEDIEMTFLTFEIKKLLGENSPPCRQQLFQSGQAPNIISSISPDGFAQKDLIAPWTPEELEAAGLVDLTAGAIDGKVYGLNIGVQPIPMVYYNKTMFKEAGIDKAPTSYAELMGAGTQLKAAGFNAFEVGGGGVDTWVATFALNGIVSADMLIDTPDWFLKRSKDEVKFTDPEFIAAAQKTADLKANGFIDPDGLTRSYSDVEQAFLSGKAAMYPMGSWFSLAADGADTDFEIGVFGWPSDAGTNVVPVVSGGGLMVNAEAPDVDLAKKWILAYELDKENMDAGVKTDGLMYNIEGYEFPEGMGPVFTETANALTTAQETGNTAPAWGNINGDGSLPPGFNDKLAPAIIDLFNGKMDAQKFAEYLDQQYAALAVN